MGTCVSYYLSSIERILPVIVVSIFCMCVQSSLVPRLHPGKNPYVTFSLTCPALGHSTALCLWKHLQFVARLTCLPTFGKFCCSVLACLQI